MELKYKESKMISWYLVRTLKELGIYFDEEGRLRSTKDNSIITMENLTTDPLLTVTSITQYVNTLLSIDHD